MAVGNGRSPHLLMLSACSDYMRARFKYVLPFYFVLGVVGALLGVALRCAIGTAARFYWHSGPVKWHSGPVYGTAARFHPQVLLAQRPGSYPKACSLPVGRSTETAYPALPMVRPLPIMRKGRHGVLYAETTI